MSGVFINDSSAAANRLATHEGKNAAIESINATLSQMQGLVLADCIIEGETLAAKEQRGLVKSAACHIDTAIVELKLAKNLAIVDLPTDGGES